MFDGLLPERDADRTTQGFVFEIKGDDQTEIVINLDDSETLVIPLADARSEDHLYSLTDESVDRLESEFEIGAADIDNPDVVYHNARKVHVGYAYHISACKASITFDDLPSSGGRDYYYVRAAQRDGQYAWASPIWVDE